jgi:hypothetical protein
VDRIKQDDLLSARELSAKDKLSQALEVMAYGLEVKRQNLKRANPDASECDVDLAFDTWLFARG